MKKYRKYILGILVLVLLGGAGYVGYKIYNVSSKEPEELSKRNDDLAFMTDRDGHWDIVMVNPDNEITNLTQDSNNHNYFPYFSFDGTLVSFYAINEGEYVPAVVNADGSEYRALSWMSSGAFYGSREQVNQNPAWSPDGNRVLRTFINVLAFKSQIYVANADRSDDQNLMKDGGTGIMAVWSPDGTRIAYASDRNKAQDIYIMDVETGEETRLTGDEAWDFQPAWSLDGTQILYISDREDSLLAGDLTKFVIDVATGDVHPLGEDEVFAGGPAYSADGAQVAYMSNESGTWHIYIMDADGSNVRQITEGETNNMFPVWRPIPVDEGGEDAPASE